MGDGETQEGQIWEALMYGGVKQVKNIVAIFDYNKVQLSSTMRQNTDLEPLLEKLAAFHWTVLETDGHDMEMIVETLKRARDLASSKPLLL